MSGVSLFDRDESSVAVWWRPTAGATEYRLEMMRRGGDWEVLGRTRGTMVRKKNLKRGETYAFRVVATSGEETPSGELSTCVAEGKQLAAPRCLDFDGESAVLEFERGPVTLEMFDGEQGWTAVARVAGSHAKKKGLTPGRRYYFRAKPDDDEEYEFSRASDAIAIPRKAPKLETSFGPFLRNVRGDLVDTATTLAGRVVAVYAAASW
mmetsp:Transcript_31815/g.101902  ORF Transcript_31815/g.101902 Transcript_31815/m.101902 type:complete len:208 (+) Transcript_31815:52-675(+)